MHARLKKFRTNAQNQGAEKDETLKYYIILSNQNNKKIFKTGHLKQAMMTRGKCKEMLY